VIEELPLTDFAGPFDASLKARAVAALEAGAVLYFPQLAFRLTDLEKEFLDAKVSDGKSKNISVDPVTGKIQSTSLSGEKAERLAAMIGRFGAGATALVNGLLPYRNVERARTSYRPVQVKGRSYSKKSDDRRLHVDAFPTRPLRGRRILRFFANIAPPGSLDEGLRRWQIGEPFEDFAREFLPRLRSHVPGEAWLLSAIGATRGKRTRYDELMLSLHDTGKMDDAFQANSPQQAVSFPPNTCWMVFTDQVLHAALSGEFALEQTFHFDVADMAEPARAPIKVLERLTGRALA
jgi:hypothetical protein